ILPPSSAITSLGADGRERPALPPCEVTGVAVITSGLQPFERAIVDTLREPVILLDRDFRVVAASRSFYKTFHVGPLETEGRIFFDLGNRQWDIAQLRQLLDETNANDSATEEFEVA